MSLEFFGNPIVQSQLVIAEIHMGEYLIAREQVVDDGQVVEQLLLRQCDLLSVAVHQEHQLGLESEGPHVLVESVQEGVFLDPLFD